MRTYSLTNYEASQPEGSQKLTFENYIVRAYVKDGELHVTANRRTAEGQEELPLGYILGSNALIFPKKRG